MLNVLYATLVLAALGLVFGVALAIAGNVFKVETDERVEKVLACLPGANCGGCGFSGCSALANAIVDGKAKPNGCPVCDSSAVEKIGKIMGVDAHPAVRYRAQVMCSGTNQLAKSKYDYDGISDCLSAVNLANGHKQCPYGCIGYGSCVKVCAFDAIKVENGVAVVEYEKCKACGMCVDVCPKNIIKLVPYEANVWVGCRSKDKGKTVMEYCKNGCITCGKCVRTCKYDAIHIIDDCAQIDYDKCTGCGECVAVCPTKVIWSGKNQIELGDTVTDLK